MAMPVMEVGKLTKMIGVIGRQKVRIDNMVQIAAVQCIAQSLVHRNSTPAQQLYEAVANVFRRDALLQYLELFGNLTWSKVQKRIIFYDHEQMHGPERKREWTDEYSLKVAAFRWTKGKKEPEPKSMFDVEDEVCKLIDRLRANAKRGAKLEHADLLDQIAVLYVTHVSASAMKGMKADNSVIEAGEAAQKIADAKAQAEVEAADAYVKGEAAAILAGRNTAINEAAAPDNPVLSPEVAAQLRA